MNAKIKMTKNGKKLNRICMLSFEGYFEYPPSLGKTETGGQVIYVLDLARALAKKGIKVDIVTRQFNNKPTEEVIFPNVKIIRVPGGPNTFIRKEKIFEYIPEMMENLMLYIQKTQKIYNLIHSHYWLGGYGGLLLAKMLDIPHVHSPHSLRKVKQAEMLTDVDSAPPSKLKRLYRYHVAIAIEQKIINKADAIVLLCETNRIQILQHYIADFEKLHVIFPGIDTRLFTTKKNDNDKKIDLKKNSVLITSRLVTSKGHDRLIDAIYLLKRRLDVHLYIASALPGPESTEEEILTKNKLDELIKKYKLQDQVTFLGQVEREKLPAYYRSADVFVLASRFEQFGLTTMEAMACGAPAIVSSVAGSREVIVDGLNGFIVDTHDRKALAACIEKLLTDSKLRKKIAENAAFTIAENYSWDKICDKFINLYMNLL